MNIKMHNYKQKQMAWCWWQVRLEGVRAGTGVEEEAGESRALPACDGDSWESPSPPLSGPRGFKTQGPRLKIFLWFLFCDGAGWRLWISGAGWPRLDPRLCHLLTMRAQAKKLYCRKWGHRQLDLPLPPARFWCHRACLPRLLLWAPRKYLEIIEFTYFSNLF